VEVRRHQIVELEETGGRQHHVGERRSVRREQVEHDGEQVVARQRLPQPRLLRA